MSYAPVLLDEIEAYWTRRAESYSEQVQYEMAHENLENWMNVIETQFAGRDICRVLDVGTGPGFFAIGLTMRGYQVTAVDYTAEMLLEARRNAGALASRIRFCRMDAQHLDFADETFDAVVTRNLTWNLQRPDEAYREWHRVLKPGGLLLNFDAAWYSYLFDEEKRQGFEEDRRQTRQAGVTDFESYSESAKMEEISRELILSRCVRPQADLEMLADAGFAHASADTSVGGRVWDAREQVNYASRPLFMIRAEK